MSLRETRDAAFLNAIANHAAVRPHIGLADAGPLDLAALMAQPDCFALANEHGGFLCIGDGAGVYELHTLFLPSGRGRRALAAAGEVQAILFARGAVALTSYLPHDNKAALGLLRAHNWRCTHSDAAASYWRIGREEWQARRRMAAA